MAEVQCRSRLSFLHVPLTFAFSGINLGALVANMTPAIDRML